ncbi:MAG: Bacterial Ig domain, partial [Thermoleophilaceae bacterium]|nr:Bacterial Ig domain [Thermoleophilaceae bacterium]
MTTAAERPRSRQLVPAILAGILATVLFGVGAAIWLSSDGTTVVHAAAAEPVPDPVLTALLPSGPRMAAPWNAPLTLSVIDGSLKAVTVLDPDGQPLPGTSADPSSWQSVAQSLLP